MKIIVVEWLCASFFLIQAVLPRTVSSARQAQSRDSLSAEPLPPTEISSKETEYVSCWKRGEPEIKSRLVRSPVLVSRDSQYRARVVVEATALKPKNEAVYSGRLCFNDSTLFVDGPGGKNFKIVYSDSPNVSEGNSIKLIDWAPDGKSLLLETAKWEYESEGIYTEFLIFSVDPGTIVEPDLREMLATRFGKDCWSENTVLGFTPSGNVIVAVRPDADETGLENGAISCVKRKTLVSVSLTGPPGKRSQTLPANTKVVQNGTFLPSSPR